jgi:hypothetical protein
MNVVTVNAGETAMRPAPAAEGGRVTERYRELSRDEQRILVFGAFALATLLWVGIVWGEPSALAGIPFIGLLCGLLIVLARRRPRPETDDWDSSL